MAGAFQIISKLTTTDYQGYYAAVATTGNSAPSNGALLIPSLQENFENAGKNQVWEAVADPSNPGFFFLQNLQKNAQGQALVMDIQGVNQSKTAGDIASTKLQGWTQDQGWHYNQLWTTALSPGDKVNVSAPPAYTPTFIVIQSYLKNSSGVPYVVNVAGSYTSDKVQLNSGTHLDIFPQKTSDNGNQHWMIGLPPGYPPLGQHPKLANLISTVSTNVNTNVTEISFSFTGSGFAPGQVLAFLLRWQAGQLTTQGTPFLGVSDFGGNFVVGAPTSKWGFSQPQGGPERTVEFLVYDNSGGIFSQNALAVVTALWDGAEFTNTQYS